MEGILQVILGIILVFFLPGLLLMELIFKHNPFLERLLFGIATSIGIAILIGLILGYLHEFTLTNIGIIYVLIVVALILIKILKK